MYRSLATCSVLVALIAALADASYPCDAVNPKKSIFAAKNGIITSQMNGQSTYAASLNCSWNISVAGGQIVEISVGAIDTQPLKDQLFLHDGLDSSSPLVLRLSGNQTARTYITSGARAFIRFETDGSDQRTGFSITFRAILRTKSNCLESNTWFYTGRETLTVTRRTCQNWTLDFPHSHSYHDPTHFADGQAGYGSNFCRYSVSPSGTAPWCYTTSATSWEYCNIPVCTGSMVVGIDCVRADTWFYAGNISTTTSGKTCQRWDTNTPHTVTAAYRNPDNFVDSVNGYHSGFCRNPFDGVSSNQLWCYTTTPPLTWDNCQLPSCNANSGNPMFDPPLFPCTSGVSYYDARNQFEGTIRSHPSDFYPSQYFPNMNCSWTIDVTQGAALLTITDFNLTSPDALRIFAGSNSSSPLVALLTGDLGSFTIQINGSLAFLRFTSNSVYEASGFSIYFNRSLSNRCVTATSSNSSGGWIQYPLSGNYDNSLDCLWPIGTNDTSMAIYVVITKLDTQWGNLCPTDVLNFETASGTYIAGLCGNTITIYRYYFKYNKIAARFYTDSSIVATGLAFNFTYVPASSGCEYFIATSTTASGGWLRFPQSGDYFNFADCSWIIGTNTTNGNVTFTVVWLDTQASVDILRVEAMNGTQLNSFSGSITAPVVYKYKLAQVRVRFTSDSWSTASGFNFTYSFYPSQTQMTTQMTMQVTTQVTTTMTTQVTTKMTTQLTTPVAAATTTPVATTMTTHGATVMTTQGAAATTTPVATTMTTHGATVMTTHGATVMTTQGAAAMTTQGATVMTTQGATVMTTQGSVAAATTPVATMISPPVATPLTTPVATVMTTPVATVTTIPVATVMTTHGATMMTTPVAAAVTTHGASAVTTQGAAAVTTHRATAMTTHGATVMTTHGATATTTPVTTTMTTHGATVMTTHGATVMTTPVATAITPPVATPMTTPVATVMTTTASSGPCFNEGLLRSLPAGFACQCPAAIAGYSCEIQYSHQCPATECQRGANCYVSMAGEHVCACPPGLSGDDCSIDNDECLSSPCDKGRCLNYPGSFKCSCYRGYTGKLCETELNECNSNPCRRNGTCFDLIDDYRCVCIATVTGKSCEIVIDECASKPCQNGAVCIDGDKNFTCECGTYFSGKFCEIDGQDLIIQRTLSKTFTWAVLIILVTILALILLDCTCCYSSRDQRILQHNRKMARVNRPRSRATFLVGSHRCI